MIPMIRWVDEQMSTWAVTRESYRPLDGHSKKFPQMLMFSQILMSSLEFLRSSLRKDTKSSSSLRCNSVSLAQQVREFSQILNLFLRKVQSCKIPQKNWLASLGRTLVFSLLASMDFTNTPLRVLSKVWMRNNMSQKNMSNKICLTKICLKKYVINKYVSKNMSQKIYLKKICLRNLGKGKHRVQVRP